MICLFGWRAAGKRVELWVSVLLTCFGEVVRALIAEVFNRFPGRLSTTAVVAHGNQICTVDLLANEVAGDFETKIGWCKALIGKRFR